MIIVRTPNKNFTGTRCGLAFVQGVAETEVLDPATRAQCEARGYTVEAPVKITAPKPPPAARKPKAEANG